MKKLVLFLLFLCTVFGVGFSLGRYQLLPFIKNGGEAPLTKFTPAPFPLVDLPITVVIIGKDNGAFIEKSLSSVFSQAYENYKVIYIDDASEDGSYELARDIIYNSSQMMRVTHLKNEESLGFLANLVRAVDSCPDQEIIAILGEEDCFAHEWTLQKINSYYQDPNLWVAYGQYVETPNFQKGETRPLMQGESVRSAPFTATHMQTFYAGLFKRIRPTDLAFGERYFQESYDLAYMIPMIEMAEEHTAFVSEVLYISNNSSSKKRDRELMVQCEQAIRSFPSYNHLDTPPFKMGEEL